MQAVQQRSIIQECGSEMSIKANRNVSGNWLTQYRNPSNMPPIHRSPYREPTKSPSKSPIRSKLFEIVERTYKNTANNREY